MALVPAFHAQRCVRHRYRYSECRRCVDACPHGAVKLTDGGVAVDETKCERCLLCVSACRTEALTAADLQWDSILREALQRGRFTFSCTPSEAEGDAVVPCLGALNAGMLAFLLKRGVAVDLRGSWHCSGCLHAPQGSEWLSRNVDAVKILRRTFEGSGWGDIVLKEPDGSKNKGDGAEGAYMASRRQLFRLAADRGVNRFVKAVIGESPMQAQPEGIRAAPPAMTSQRELMQVFKPDNMSPDATLPLHPALPLGRVEVGPGCTACEACARVCPAGALRVSEAADAWTLEFDFSRCVACDVCVEACQPKVLQIQEMDRLSFEMDGSEPLYRFSKGRCSQCDRYFISDGSVSVCKVCRDDEQDFASLFG